MDNTISTIKEILTPVADFFLELLTVIFQLIYIFVVLIWRAALLLIDLFTQFLQWLFQEINLFLQWVAHEFSLAYSAIIRFLDWGIEENGPIFIVGVSSALIIAFLVFIGLIIQIRFIQKQNEFNARQEQLQIQQVETNRQRQRNEEIVARNNLVKDATLGIVRILFR
jgi:hypothetical protein